MRQLVAEEKRFGKTYESVLRTILLRLSVREQ